MDDITADDVTEIGAVKHRKGEGTNSDRYLQRSHRD
jgi:hypothetical protein